MKAAIMGPSCKVLLLIYWILGLEYKQSILENANHSIWLQMELISWNFSLKMTL